MIFFKEKFTQKKGKIVLSFKVLPIKKNKKKSYNKRSCQAPKGFKKHHKSSAYESYSKSSEAIRSDCMKNRQNLSHYS